MALVDNAWYLDYGNGSSTGYYAVTAWATGTAKSAGALIRQNATPTVGNERVFVCIVAGTTHATTEPTWVVTRGAKNTDNTVTWQECTGIAALNGDVTNTPNWTTVKNTAVTLGQVIKRNSAASFQICTTAGTAGNGSEPSFSDTAGTTTSDNTVTWTSLGVVGNFTGWQAPHARKANLCTSTWCQAGNQIFTASSHAETQSTAMAITYPGTTANPNVDLCVTKTTVPPVSANITTGATITTTGANNLSIGGACCIYGQQFSAGTGAVTSTITVAQNGTSNLITLVNCKLIKAGTAGTTTAITLGSSSADPKIILDNTTVQFGAAGDSLRIQAVNIIWKNTSSAIAGATIPTTLFNFNASPAISLINAVDLSAMGSGKTLVAASNLGSIVNIKNCTLGSSVTIAAPSTASGTVNIINCDSGATNTRNERYHYTGTQTIETTIVRTGGATDKTTPYSWKIVTTANSKWIMPFESFPMPIWNDVTGSNVTITVYGIWGGGAVPNNDDIWIEVWYMGSSSTPIDTIATLTKADYLATGSALATDTSTWGGSTTPFKMALTFSSPQPQMKGYIYAIVKAAKPSTTFYIDPKPVLS